MIYIFPHFGKSDEGFFKSTSIHPAKLALILCQFITAGTREPLGREHVVLACTRESAVGVCDRYLLKHLAVPPGGPDETI